MSRSTCPRCSAALGEAQDLFGRISGLVHDDKSEWAKTEVATAAERGFELCVAALSEHPLPRGKS